MARRRKFLVPGSVVHLTANTVLGRYLFGPCVRFNKRVTGIIRRYQKVHGMQIHIVVILSNHYHLLVRPRSQTQLSDFMRDVNASLARLIQQMYPVVGRIFARPFDQSECLEGDAVMEHYLYIMANSVTENAVEDPRHWPGVHSARELCGERPFVGVYFDGQAFKAAMAKNRAADPKAFWVHEAIELTPIPMDQGKSRHQRETANRHRVKQIISDAAAARTKPVTTAAAVLKQSPMYTPDSVKVSKIARFHVRGTLRTEILLAAREAYRAMAHAYDWAMAKFIGGDHEVEFPQECYLPLMVRAIRCQSG